MQESFAALSKENKELKEKLNSVTMMLYHKIEENNQLQRQLD
jgi:hypothetical protein